MIKIGKSKPLARIVAVARALIGGGCIFIYSGCARLVSFEIKLISKEVSRAEPEYMNIHPPPISVLATALGTISILFPVGGHCPPPSATGP